MTCLSNLFLTLVSVAALLAGCSNGGGQPEPAPGPEPGPEPEVVTGPGADIYVTTASKAQLFSKSFVEFGKAASMSPYLVKLDPSVKYQTVDGFGAAVTGATCFNLLKMTPEDRTAILKDLFDPEEGLGVSLVRVSIGASDFSVNEEFTWCDKEGIENFAVAREDKEYLFPILHEIYKINPGLKIIASPWSCPRWMKRRSVTDNSDYYSWTSGSLKPSCYQDYATYFVKWIQTMEAEGFDIYAMTIQNEPLNHGNSMSLYMTWQEQRDFIKTALGPAFEKAGIDTKILVFDHNYNYDNVSDQSKYPLNIFADPEASKYVAGSAWHNYGGTPLELTDIVKSAPDKEIYFTESSIGEWGYSFEGNVLSDFKSIFLQTLERGNKGVTLWNFVLDENNSPYRKGGCSTCYGVLEIDSTTGKIKGRNSHYYDIAHTSKVIKPGAVRIGTNGYTTGNVTYQAYQNPDGSYGVIILNENSDSKELVFASTAHSVKITVPGKAVASIAWKD